jgi:FkbM family methyltransferase
MPDEIDTRLIAHHVGARGFVVAMDVPKKFEPDLVHVTYEADADCAADMQARLDRPNYHILPVALGRADGEATLHVTTNPYGSSLYAPNPDYATYYGEVYPTTGGVYDAVFGAWCKVERETPIATASLDGLFAAGRVPVAAGPDFLSLDTQGSEADIIAGAEKTIAGRVLAIATEFEFHPIYRDQPLFSRILDALGPLGFQFAGFLHIADEISPYSRPVGQRGRSFLAFGDALFLRRLDDLPAMAAGDKQLLCTLAFKAAFIGVVFGFIEYALEALALGMSLAEKGDVPESLHARAYYRMLVELEMARQKMEPLSLPTQPYTVRTEPGEVREDPFAKSRIAKALRWTRAHVVGEFKLLYDQLNRYVDSLPYRRIRHLVTRRPAEAALRCFVYGLRFIDSKIVRARDTSPYYARLTAFERVLEVHDLNWVAALVRRRRMRAIRALADVG